jgi:hypothetical protein
MTKIPPNDQKSTVFSPFGAAWYGKTEPRAEATIPLMAFFTKYGFIMTHLQAF